MKRFLLGFAIGATASAVIVLATAPKSGMETRQSMRIAFVGMREHIAIIQQSYAETRQQIVDRVQYAIEVGRAAAAAREQELWAEFHQRRQAAREQAAKEKDKPDWRDYYY